MDIEVNGESKKINETANLKSLVDDIVDNTKGMAVAINSSVIPQSEWSGTLLKENDKILLIRATQGG